MKPEIAIAGAGLSGLLLAYLLRERYRITLLEARPRIGGRILTVTEDGAAFDLGPTWIWPHHHYILQLCDALGLTLFRHYDRGAYAYDAPSGVQYFRSPQSAPSYRLAGGAQSLTDALMQRLDGVTLHLNAPVRNVIETDSGVTVHTPNASFDAAQCILTLPPRLCAETVVFDPPLEAGIRARMEAVPTWMGFSAKCIVTYKAPFWRSGGLSGFAASHLGPLSEVHDAAAGEKAALFGFYHANAADDARSRAVIEQLARLFGPQAYTYEGFHYHNWRNDPHTSVAADRAPLQSHPAYGLETTLSPRIRLCGTEASHTEGGYLEGAVIAAMQLASELMQT